MTESMASDVNEKISHNCSLLWRKFTKNQGQICIQENTSWKLAFTADLNYSGEIQNVF